MKSLDSPLTCALFNEIGEALSQVGRKIVVAHAESASGQFEFSTESDEPLKVWTITYVLKI